MNLRCCRRLMLLASTLSACLVLRLLDAPAQNAAGPAPAPEAQWIWSPAHTKDLVPAGACFFRHSLVLKGSERGHIQIACDDAYELYVNGRQMASGDDWRRMTTYELVPYLQSGRNVIAVKAANKTGASAGLAVRIKLAGPAGGEIAQVSDTSWKTSLKQSPGWETIQFDDSQWIPARSFGPFGSTPPWTNQVAGDGGGAGRFILPAEFRVEQVVSPEQTGSLLAMAFNEWGDIIASREGGALIAIVDEDRDGVVETASTYCDVVKNCQGILALNGEVFAIGEGPQGPALYRLSDEDADDVAETATMLVLFDGAMGEHGPHVPVLGPDGLIYMMVGNHAQISVEPAAESPHHHFYEGELVEPRYEDANGHAAGLKAPGGTVLRTNTEGDFVQIFAGGFRNAYDIAFNRQGDLFTYDSDMEWDVGQPWYRPTRINHVVAGGEYGWRSGWAVWPPYYVDSLPSTLDTGRGSPTGVEFYNHFRFPVRYHNAMFACDWSQGRILAIRMQPAGGTYAGQAEVFLEGRPLNATDIAVGPDGWLYFCTGGRGTQGGIYRVVWTGSVPPRPKIEGVLEAIRQPQLHSAFARQQVAAIQQTLGGEWDRQLATVVDNSAYSINDRTRALDLMQLVGPFPTTQMLVRVSRETNAELRSK
ncbi:MAG: heme-binding protein, partial [Pirellulales bacterium]